MCGMSHREALLAAARRLLEEKGYARITARDLVARSFGGRIPADDPRCAAVASFVLAVCDGLAVQWLVDPEGTPDSAGLLAGLAEVWAQTSAGRQSGERPAR